MTAEMNEEEFLSSMNDATRDMYEQFPDELKAMFRKNPAAATKIFKFSNKLSSNPYFTENKDGKEVFRDRHETSLTQDQSNAELVEALTGNTGIVRQLRKYFQIASIAMVLIVFAIFLAVNYL